ncbi:MAG: FeoB-associated Cys-rich membrane protein [Muribaculaceae bacterium]|nr:FeoB-associated Cys-rich membrane protein [Muribaculaceae bacterium]
MDKNLLIQSTIVGIILFGALIWAAYRAFFRKKNSQTGCSGCSLAENCSKIKKYKNRNSDNCKK